MFEKKFTYSDVDRKYNRIRGVGGTVLLILFLFPVFGMLCNLFSCYVMYLTPLQHRIVYYAFTVVLAVMLVLSVIRWVNEMFTMYAIDKNGKVYRFKMIAFALEYLGIGEKARESAQMASMGRTGRFMATYQMIVKMRETVEKLKNDSQLEELIMQGCAVEVKFKSVEQRKWGISCQTDIGNINIRNVYLDGENLMGYIEFYCKNDCKTGIQKQYEPVKKTTLEQLINKKNYLQRVAGKTVWVTGICMWALLLMCSGDLGKQAQINHGNYKYAEAECSDIERNGSKYTYTFVYAVDGKDYSKNIIAGKDKYKKGDTIERYYNVDNPEETFGFADSTHVNVKPVLVIFLMCELIIVLVCMDFEEFKKE